MDAKKTNNAGARTAGISPATTHKPSNTQANSESVQASIATLLGGTSMTVAKLDGTTEEVKVRQLPVKLMPEMMSRLGDESALVELFCERPPGWSETLTLADFEKLAAEGDRINADFFSRWSQRMLSRQEKAVPGIVEKLLKQSPSLSSLRTLPTNAG